MVYGQGTVEAMFGEFDQRFLYSLSPGSSELVRNTPKVLECNKHVETLRRN